MNFTEEEKKLITELDNYLNGDSFSLLKFLQMNFFTDLALFLFAQGNILSLYMPESVYNNDVEKRKAVQKFGTLIKLLDFLVKEEYILFVPYCKKSRPSLRIIWIESASDFTLTNGETVLDQATKLDFRNGNVYKDGKLYYLGLNLGSNFFNKFEELMGDVYPLPKLRYLIENDFLSEEEVRHKQSLDVAKANLSKAHETLTESERSISVAKRAIVVSVIIAIVTTIINVCLNLHIASDRTVVLDNDQNAVFVKGQNKTIEAIKTVGTQLDDSINVHVNNQLSVKDTISTVQVKKVRPAQSKSGNQKPQD